MHKLPINKEHTPPPPPPPKKNHTHQAKKKICVFTVTCQKNLGSVGQD